MSAVGVSWEACMYDTNINKDKKEAEGKEEVLTRVLHPQLGCALPSFLPKKGRVSHLMDALFPFSLHPLSYPG